MGALGWLVGAQVQSPADAAAAHRAPAASLVTVAVKQQRLTATEVAQGTVSYGPPHPLVLTGAVARTGGDDGDTSALITKAPVEGRTLHEGDVLLEVSGRPVFVFTGKVPMYRTLAKGSAGDDVRQLRRALRKLMPDRSLAAKGPFNDAVMARVKEWYGRRGYAANGPSAEAKARLKELQQEVTQNDASARGDSLAASPGSRKNASIKRGSAGTAESSDSGQTLAQANAALKAFKKTYGITLASGEVLFLPKLPIRLVTVSAKPGGEASGEIGKVADPVLVVNGTVGTDEADLLKKGMPATLVSGGGASYKATLTGMGASVAPPRESDDGSGGDGDGASTARRAQGGADDNANDAGEESVSGVPIRLKPANPKKLAALAEEAVKITIRLGETGKAVLTVPVAAVFTSADAHARVSVQTGPAQTRDVPVTTGLTANGYVHVTAKDAAQLRPGDRVVVGRR
jgi:hypothetical protein